MAFSFDENNITDVRDIPVELTKRYVEEGWWRPETLGQMLADGLAASPDAGFYVHSATRPYQGTFREVEHTARRLAAGLRDRGVGPGDVVALQLPNWMEAAVAFWASAFLGAVTVPIVHFYGRKELGHIMATAKPKVFLTTEQFGRMKFEPDLCAEVPIVGLVGQSSFTELLAEEPMSGTLTADPAAPALIAFTSGTTREPKGVIHSHQTLGFETRQLLENYPPNRGRQLTATPVGHFIGMLGAFLIPVLEGAPIDLCDVWDPGKVLELIERDELSIGGGPPYFVTSLMDHPQFNERHLARFTTVGLGGSTVPATVTRRLAELGLFVFRSYGSTEHPSITGSGAGAPEAKRLYTDGNVRPGVEIRLGPDGEIFSRGPDLCLGYTDDALTAKHFDSDGWYRTGDIGVLDEDGYLTITDRTADLIIRGGENISALEVEEVLLGLPDVIEAIVVAAPDARLGERVAAVLRVRDGGTMPTLDQVRSHFESSGVARQKWPEELHLAEDFPRTASGKVQKFVIRQEIAAIAR
ncbi:AMP-dependent synthetase/ligase [Mycolicibacterium fortuitum subsp. fortuitum DSM 46621 = ATCC 6841 = JCM 6387]|uniref:AMP-dependent synthetase and ligase n=2 Tax=Mycolicibacterium fortuitum TaxID=1766 RepID=A0A378UT12_MYCFO|nr:AMP-dependent synthetase/ligase [Mycolicibacterium fortuitum subsp. fortuitum DSM 46621 = ATCC 6841 = JCM 6387]BDE00017.1 long-chain-fatty-acid--CoA ligase [Mycolicibacterium fortuitum subsp. fortuitum]CRL53850.1 AMP-dependent synthetase/ligase [Mycolicibacterium fortuitum subsp. fortuitum DSM 46621 = ATCC 6841 = JCM 6387]CRL82330.1 AMP-dependent synthetase/ligase [Mycolicibacter nonchromogenicus]STZ88014.1 AMP-dependent synthetase and ligase [Mycolicibacterium fortuitum]